MRTAYDAVTPSNIPRNAEVVMGYVNGPYAWNPSDWAMFPNAVKITIATHPDNTTSHMIDYENGDFTDANVVQAVKVRQASGRFPIVYCSESVWAHVRSLFTAAGVPEPLYLVAAYPGAGPTIPSGAIGHQYEDYQNKYDISVIDDYIPGVDTMTDPFNDAGAQFNGQTMTRGNELDGVFEAVFIGGPDFGPSIKDQLNTIVETLGNITSLLQSISAAQKNQTSNTVFGQQPGTLVWTPEGTPPTS